MLSLVRRRSRERAAHQLYCAAVAAARQPYFYERLGVPDTLDGRFEMVGLHAFLLIRRLQQLADPETRMAQAVFDAMFSDMDTTLREMGVGDLGVGKRVRVMWEAFHGRAAAYQLPLADRNSQRLAEALARNVWRDPAALVPAARLAAIAMAQDRHLATQDSSALAAGKAEFLSPEAVAA